MTREREIDLAAPEWRIEGPEKVTGVARFAADFRRPGMLHAAFVRSPYPHARIRSVDTAAATGMPGVKAVITGADVDRARFGRLFQDWPALCWDTVRFIGDRVAAVAAESPEIAEAAANVVRVDYDPLPAVFEPEDALRPDAPILHPEADSYGMLRGRRPHMPHPNLQDQVIHEHGDPQRMFGSAHRVFEHTFDLARVHQGYLEPRASLVWIEPSAEGDRVHVLTTNKAPFQLREQMALSLGLPLDSIEVHTGHIGGDFGGKGLSLDEWPLYFLARTTGRPVRAVMRYADELQVSNTRHAARIRLRTGIDKDGRIVAHEARIVFNGGAYAAGNPGPRLVPIESMGSLPGYRVPAVRVEAIDVYTNTIPGGNARCPGGPQLLFAAESHMDMIARDLGVDPLEFRSKNLAEVGDLDVHGDAWTGSQIRELLALIRRSTDWAGPRPDGHGRGIAIAHRHSGLGHAPIGLTLAEDGTVEVLTGLSDQGAGAFTALQRVVARELGLSVDRVRVTQTDTTIALKDPGVGGSRVTAVFGNAAVDAAKRLRRAVEARAPGASLSEAARTLAPLTVTGIGEQEQIDQASCAYVLEVAVDRETGSFRITNAHLAVDVGTVINPVALRGQLEGGFAFGLGQAMTEELRLEEGRVVDPSLGDYKLPTVEDVPPLQLSLWTGVPGPGPYGAKSVGELVNSPVGAALANAIHDAVGVRIASLPVTAERVFEGLRAPVPPPSSNDTRRGPASAP